MKNVCCICGFSYKGYGNNPYPVITTESARCCDACNDTYVIRARLMHYDVEEIQKRIEILKAMRNVIELGIGRECDALAYEIAIVNRVTAGEGVATFIPGLDEIKVYEGNGDGSDDACYSFEQFVIKYQFEIRKAY